MQNFIIQFLVNWSSICKLYVINCYLNFDIHTYRLVYHFPDLGVIVGADGKPDGVLLSGCPNCQGVVFHSYLPTSVLNTFVPLVLYTGCFFFHPTIDCINVLCCFHPSAKRMIAIKVWIRHYSTATIDNALQALISKVFAWSSWYDLSVLSRQHWFR